MIDATKGKCDSEINVFAISWMSDWKISKKSDINIGNYLGTGVA